LLFLSNSLIFLLLFLLTVILLFYWFWKYSFINILFYFWIIIIIITFLCSISWNRSISKMSWEIDIFIIWFINSWC